MISKKLLIALAVLLGASSASLAQGARHYYGAPYGPGYGAPFGGDYGDYYDYAPGYGYRAMPYDYGEARPVDAQPSPSRGVESQR